MNGAWLCFALTLMMAGAFAVSHDHPLGQRELKKGHTIGGEGHDFCAGGQIPLGQGLHADAEGSPTPAWGYTPVSDEDRGGGNLIQALSSWCMHDG